jgi:hypothetical protein
MRTRFNIAVWASLSVALTASAVAAADLPRRPALGVSLANELPADVRAAQKLAPNEGVLVIQVQPGLSADAAGLKAGDVLITLDGKRLGTSADVTTAIPGKRVGDVLNIGYVRSAARATANVALKAMPFETAADLDITYGAVSATGGLRRTVTVRPKTAGRHPAVLMVTGIGCYPADAPLNEQDGYRQLVNGLARQDFVVMRVEKSGIGDSTGKPCAQVDLETEVDGNVAGLRALKQMPGVDSARVFIVGHSIGGVTGPLVARKETVKGLFVFETLGLNWFEYELLNTRRQLKLGGETPANIAAQMHLKAWCSHRHLIDRMPRAELLKAKPECADLTVYPTSDAYIQQVAAQNLPDVWAKLKGVDVAVLYGKADFVTGVEESMALVAAANAARAGSATYIELPDLDHFLLQAESQAASFQRLQTGGTPVFHPKLVTTVADWLKSKSR